MSKFIQFGEEVNGYNSRVLNEREIRAAAGILFLATFISLAFIMFENNFLPIKYVLTVFLPDFIIRVFVNPRFSPTLIIGRCIVSKQVPEYVSAAPKRFAWMIGVALSAVMFILMVIFNSYSIITGSICLTCLVFLFFESAFGICIGCTFYALFHKEKTLHCSGESCTPKPKEEVQQLSGWQFAVLVFFAIFIVVTAWLFNDLYTRQPHALFTIFGE